MAAPVEIRTLERRWNKDDGNLETELLLYDFFRREEGYRATHPLIVCKGGGLMALYGMEGIDPEPQGEDGLEAVSAALRRALDTLNPANLEGDWRGGAWEVQNIFTRAEGKAPLVAEPTRDSQALRYLARACNDYWQEKRVYHDEILWAFKFTPRFRDRTRAWKLRDAQTEAVLRLDDLRAEARMVRRVLRVAEENLLAFSTRRPKMGFGLRALGEEESFEALWRQANRRWGKPGRLRTDLPLVVQVACSERDNTGEHYRIDGTLTRVLTWKVPPAVSISYALARLQNEVRFPLVVAQTFRALDFDRVQGRIARLGNFAAALAGKHPASAQYHAEAQDFLGSVRTEGACPFNWYFAVIVQADTVAELEDRAAKLGSQMKMVYGGEVMEERSNRALAEIAALPGNGQFGLRFNVVTSKNVGDLAMVYRLSPGDRTPFMLFGDRKGGVFSYSLFSRREPSWNKAVLGLPGSGKSMLLNALLLGNAMFDSQGYVLDKGNSFGPIFELLEREMPQEVSIMRLRGGEFRFNPLPLVWALPERERQLQGGTHRMVLEGGEQLPCPVEDAKTFFEAWLDSLVGQTGHARKLLQSMAELFLYRGFSEPEFMEQDLHLTDHHRRLHESLREDDRQREVYYVSGKGLISEWCASTWMTSRRRGRLPTPTLCFRGAPQVSPETWFLTITAARGDSCHGCRSLSSAGCESLRRRSLSSTTPSTKPFWRGFRLRLTGLDGRLRVRIGAQRFEMSRTGYFHAVFRELRPTSQMDDFEYLAFEGAGKLVGTILTVEPPRPAVDKGWWEGDLRSYADDRRTPGIHGTGHEDDHFGGWSNEFLDTPFTLPLHGEPRTEIFDRNGQYNGNATMYRLWPGIPFLRKIAHSVEHGDANSRVVNYAAVTFFYGSSGSRVVDADLLRVCDASARQAKSYSAEGELAPAMLTSAFEGRSFRTVVQACHVSHRGPATFTLNTPASNAGVYLRRLFDQRAARQAARISVEGQVVGTWYTVDGNDVLRWAERDFFVPPSFTAGKSTIAIKVEPLSDAPPWDVSEYRALAVKAL